MTENILRRAKNNERKVAMTSSSIVTCLGLARRLASAGHTGSLQRPLDTSSGILSLFARAYHKNVRCLFWKMGSVLDGGRCGSRFLGRAVAILPGSWFEDSVYFKMIYPCVFCDGGCPF